MVIGLDAVRLTERPLVVCDVDDVVLEFVTPFRAFLESRGHRLLPRSFRLHGNIVCAKDETALKDAAVSELIDAFFAAQEAWQTPFLGVVDTAGPPGRTRRPGLPHGDAGTPCAGPPTPARSFRPRLSIDRGGRSQGSGGSTPARGTPSPGRLRRRHGAQSSFGRRTCSRLPARPSASAGRHPQPRAAGRCRRAPGARLDASRAVHLRSPGNLTKPRRSNGPGH